MRSVVLCLIRLYERACVHHQEVFSSRRWFDAPEPIIVHAWPTTYRDPEIKAGLSARGRLLVNHLTNSAGGVATMILFALGPAEDHVV